MNAYQKSIEQLLVDLKTDEIQGLSSSEVERRLKAHGLNAVPEKRTESWAMVFVRQFESPLIYILFIAATIIFFVGPDPLDAFIITGVLFFNAIIGTIQEGRTRSILDSLRRFVVTQAIVVRDGKKLLIEDKYLVPGDIILLQEGERVPADARVLSVNNMQVDEAVLTGESTPVYKNAQVISGNAAVADQKNMLFKGTYVLAGSGRAVVVHTGVQTQIGGIQESVQEIQTDMPLKQELDRLSYWILLFILAMCVLLFAIGLSIGEPFNELLVMLTALFICVVPEGLPVVLTLVLVSGVYRMAKQRVLVKKMQAVEALGRADVIVIDKTGTLTRNEMMVSRVYARGSLWHVSGEGYHVTGQIKLADAYALTEQAEEAFKQIGYAAALLNSAEITALESTGLFDIKGDPTEAALAILAQKMGITSEQISFNYRKIYEMPFDSRTRYHAAFYTHMGKVILFVIGSPELIMQRSTQVDHAARDQLAQFLDDGLRTVAIAQKICATIDLPTDFDAPEAVQKCRMLAERNLEFLGLCGIQDAIRSDVAPIIKATRTAGIRVVMATGDHHKTAMYVAKAVGIYTAQDQAVDGVKLDHMSDEQLLQEMDTITVFSRVSPEHKLRIIKLLHEQKHIVAMTGDGINDAPSLVAADLGIAMGHIGTEVAKQAADIILLDDSFAHIMSAIEQGRHIFYTLKRTVLYFFATNFGEILIVLFALLARVPLPLTAAQILWLNLVTDGFLDVALSMEPQEKGLLARSWLQRKMHLVDSQLLYKMLFMAIPMGIGSLWMFMRYYEQDLILARTMALITMAMFQWFNAWNCRSESRSIFAVGLFSNGWLLLATGFVLCLQLLIVYAPFMQAIFKTVPLTYQQWLLVGAVSSSILWLEELRKLVARIWRGSDF